MDGDLITKGRGRRPRTYILFPWTRLDLPPVVFNDEGVGKNKLKNDLRNIAIPALSGALEPNSAPVQPLCPTWLEQPDGGLG